MKKILTLFLALGLCLPVMALPAQAQEITEVQSEPLEQSETQNSPVIGLFWKNISQVFCDISIDSQGNASSSALAYSWYNTDSVKVTVTLEKVVNNTGTYIASWSGSGTGSASASGSRSVARGTYRTKVVVDITNTGESVTLYSVTKTY